MKKRLGPLERLYPDAVRARRRRHHGARPTRSPSPGSTSSPPRRRRIAMGLRKTRRTLELIRETGDVHRQRPRHLARRGGRLLRHRPAAARPTSSPTPASRSSRASLVATPIIDECPYNLECRVDPRGRGRRVRGRLRRDRRDARRGEHPARRHRHRRDGLRSTRSSTSPAPASTAALGPQGRRRLQRRQVASSRRPTMPEPMTPLPDGVVIRLATPRRGRSGRRHRAREAFVDRGRDLRATSRRCTRPPQDVLEHLRRRRRDARRRGSTAPSSAPCAARRCASGAVMVRRLARRRGVRAAAASRAHSWSRSRRRTRTRRASSCSPAASRPAALALYESLGYEYVRTETIAPGVDLVYLEKRRR